MIEKLQQMREVFAAFVDSAQRLSETTSEYNAIFKPKLNDVSLIPRLYEWYCQCADKFGFKTDKNGRKKQFVFIVLIYFSPASIFGGEVRKELRNAIADIFGIKGIGIYRMRDNAVAWQSTYKTFAAETDKAYRHIDALLSDNGLIEA